MIYALVLAGRAVVVAADGTVHKRNTLGALLELAVKSRLAPLLLATPIAASLFLPVKPMGLAGGERGLYTIAYVFAQWCWSFALIGLAERYFASPNARWRYLADASYWMYLVHLPIVMLLQAWMLGWPLPWPAKLVLNLALTGVLLLASYRYLVRSTFMGQFLNGRKHPRTGLPRRWLEP